MVTKSEERMMIESAIQTMTESERRKIIDSISDDENLCGVRYFDLILKLIVFSVCLVVSFVCFRTFSSAVPYTLVSVVVFAFLVVETLFKIYKACKIGSTYKFLLDELTRLEKKED
jgi:hypothetical protein